MAPSNRPAVVVPAAVASVVVGTQLFVPSLRVGRPIAAVAAPAGAQPSAPAIGALGTTALALGVCGVAAGGRARRSKTAKTRQAAFDPSSMPGATEPFGFFDPLGFTKGKDEANFRRLRVAETKHGRVAMMASIGTVFSHYVKFPGFEKAPAGLGVFTDGAALPGLVAIFLVSGFLEVALWKDDPNKEPGDFSDPLGFAKSVNVERSYELNNGRMAMIAVLGQIAAELATGQDAAEQFGLLGFQFR